MASPQRKTDDAANEPSSEPKVAEACSKARPPDKQGKDDNNNDKDKARSQRRSRSRGNRRSRSRSRRRRSRSKPKKLNDWNLTFEERDTRESDKLTRHSGAKRDNKPAWMTKGVGVGEQMFGQPVGIIKPGDDIPIEPIVDDGTDPMGDVYREGLAKKGSSRSRSNGRRRNRSKRRSPSRRRSRRRSEPRNDERRSDKNDWRSDNKDNDWKSDKKDDWGSDKRDDWGADNKDDWKSDRKDDWGDKNGRSEKDWRGDENGWSERQGGNWKN